MFSRFMNTGRAMGRGLMGAGRRTRRGFASYAPIGALRSAKYATAAIGAVGVGLLAIQLNNNNNIAACAPGERTNTAFVFIKPHAVTENAKAMVESGLQAQGLKIVSQGALSAEQIDEGMLIDNHYYAIASKATLLKPEQLNVPPEKFFAQFGVQWKDALAQGVVFNAKDACDQLGLDASGLNKEWAKAKKAGKLVKFGGGFYCGLIDTVPNQKPIYVFNGFFMNMRNAYVKPGAQIYYYVVEWDSKKLSWDDFRGSVLGPTDPADAPADSLRGQILQNWKTLGLSAQPNVGDNGVHASASPFEALAERMNWLGVPLEQDDFGQALLAAGLSKKTIQEWSVDPVVTYGSPQYPIKMSLFDSLEDTNSDMCLARAMMINGKPSVDLMQVVPSAVGGVLAGVILGKMSS